mmetsp:Transcript_27789/g.39465  ORF Transcript_27789/g.39465 Transcript_27789/m.39465 type:complete len:82 (+) Transcript_27789:2709-2954(+)
MKHWKKTISKKHKKPYWFKAGAKSTWYDPTDINEALLTLTINTPPMGAADVLVQFLPTEFKLIMDWICAKSKISPNFAAAT